MRGKQARYFLAAIVVIMLCTFTEYLFRSNSYESRENRESLIAGDDRAYHNREVKNEEVQNRKLQNDNGQTEKEQNSSSQNQKVKNEEEQINNIPDNIGQSKDASQNTYDKNKADTLIDSLSEEMQSVSGTAKSNRAVVISEVYMVKTENDIISVFSYENGEKLYDTDLKMENLSEEIRCKMETGVLFYTEEELYNFLESYTS